ncbi:MAG: hypothetical protein KAR83_07660 [Thermodesulfovibrionales bacterium]|nr:hypothetical protein [Thermodesulfovibrionales bacterium]
MLVSLSEKILMLSVCVITFGSIGAIVFHLIKKNLGKDVDEEHPRKTNKINLLILLLYIPIILGAASVRIYEKFWIALAIAVITCVIIFLILARLLTKDNPEYSEMGKAPAVLSVITIAYRLTITYILFVFIFYGFDTHIQ